MASRITVSRFTSRKVTGTSVVVGGVVVVGGIVVTGGSVAGHAQAGNIRVMVRGITTSSHLAIWEFRYLRIIIFSLSKRLYSLISQANLYVH